MRPILNPVFVCDIDGHLSSLGSNARLDSATAKCGSPDDEESLRGAVARYPGVEGDGASVFEKLANDAVSSACACVFTVDAHEDPR